ncbi:unnamed protein product [Schistocephalus solidus]|uniref:Ig-like domain-containing protein n=1 Tax=Schistocephalus solidus TaxID=70667 RepID=A0A183SST0_SCHSO|nr:unnamed protein product [Schistocephalus solidus]
MVPVMSVFMLLFANLNTMYYSERLDDCPRNKVPNVSITTCHSEQVEAMMIGHHPMLVSYDYKGSLYFRCFVCPGDNSKGFIWKKIERSDKPIFTMVYGVNSSLHVDLIPPGGKVLLGKDLNPKPCIAPEDGSLLIYEFDPKIYLGTYYYRGDRNFRFNNKIWYHLDVIMPLKFDKFSEKISALPEELMKTQRIDSLTQIKQIMEYLGVVLMASPAFVDISSEVMSITSRLTPIPQPNQPCGTFNLTLYRRCFVVIPASMDRSSLEKLPDNVRINYDILRRAFGFLHDWRDIADPVQKETERQNAAAKAEELGFRMQLNESHIFLPCHYTYLRHFKLTPGVPKPYSVKNLYASVQFELPCPELDPLEIINMALAGDIQAMKSEILGFEDIRYMKTEKVVVENTENYELTCGGEFEETTFKCDSMQLAEIMWKYETSNLTFMLKSFIDERVFLTPTCALHFRSIKLTDEGVYNCYRRDLRLKHQWQKRAFIAFRLKVEKPRYRLPSKMDVLVGLTLLSSWAIILIFVWIIVTLWSYDAHKHAMMQAAERRRMFDKIARERSASLPNNFQLAEDSSALQ